jgi:hypothetical protein
VHQKPPLHLPVVLVKNIFSCVEEGVKCTRKLQFKMEFDGENDLFSAEFKSIIFCYSGCQFKYRITKLFAGLLF